MVSDELVYYQPLFSERQQIRYLLVCSPSLQVLEKKGPFWTNKQRYTRGDRQQDERDKLGGGNLKKEKKKKQ